MEGEIWRRRVPFPIRRISPETKTFSPLHHDDSPDPFNINQVDRSTKQPRYSTAGPRENGSQETIAEEIERLTIRVINSEISTKTL